MKNYVMLFDQEKSLRTNKMAWRVEMLATKPDGLS